MIKKKNDTSKVLKKLLTILLVSTMPSIAMANDIYVEQVGDDSDIALTQQGSGNTMGDATTPILIKGDSNIVTVDQIGGGNSLEMTVNGTAMAVTINTQGSGNVQAINCGSSSSATCGSSVITQNVTGDNNTVTQTLNATATQSSIINITGDSNIVTHATSGTAGHTANITVNGGVALQGNTISVTQSGAVAQHVTTTTTGAGNAVTITQSD